MPTDAIEERLKTIEQQGHMSRVDIKWLIAQVRALRQRVAGLKKCSVEQDDYECDWHRQVTALRQRVAEVKRERDGLREYLALCLDNSAGSTILAWTHGMRDSKEVVERGEQLRNRLGLPHDVKGQVEALRAHEEES